MKKYFLSFTLFACLIVWGQDVNEIVISIPEVAILDIESTDGAAALLGHKGSGHAAHYLDPRIADNTDFWINYSSIRSSSSDPSRNISAQISSGFAPDHHQIYIQASPYSGSGDGSLGVPTGKVLLSTHPQVIISGIGSCYTGDGSHNGHHVRYQVIPLDKASQPEETELSPILITYSISDN